MSFTERKDTNCQGSYETIAPTSINTAELCKDVCSLLPTCHSALFVNDTSECVLKGNLETCSEAIGQDSYLKSNPTPVEMFGSETHDQMPIDMY
jgi:hypothetical protein